MKNTKIFLILPPSSDIKKRQLENRICKNSKKDPKAFFKYVKQKMEVRDNITKMKINESCTSCGELDIAESFKTYFVSIFTTDDRTQNPYLQKNKYKKDIFISENRVERLLSSLEQQKS